MSQLILPPGYATCQAHGCRKRATRVPVLCCPKVGAPRERQHSIEAMFDIPCCPDHLPEVNVLFNEAIRIMFIQKASKAKDRPLLDFNNLWVEGESRRSRKYADMVERKKRKQQV